MIFLGVSLLLGLGGLVLLLMELNSSLKDEIIILKDAFRDAERARAYYKMRYEVEKRVRANDADILDAIRIAMKVSHPDNGGSAEDFIKFRKLYNTFGGKR